MNPPGHGSTLSFRHSSNEGRRRMRQSVNEAAGGACRMGAVVDVDRRHQTGSFKIVASLDSDGSAADSNAMCRARLASCFAQCPLHCDHPDALTGLISEIDPEKHKHRQKAMQPPTAEQLRCLTASIHTAATEVAGRLCWRPSCEAPTSQWRCKCHHNGEPSFGRQVM